MARLVSLLPMSVGSAAYTVVVLGHSQARDDGVRKQAWELVCLVSLLEGVEFRASQLQLSTGLALVEERFDLFRDVEDDFVVSVELVVGHLRWHHLLERLATYDREVNATYVVHVDGVRPLCAAFVCGGRGKGRAATSNFLQGEWRQAFRKLNDASIEGNFTISTEFDPETLKAKTLSRPLHRTLPSADP